MQVLHCRNTGITLAHRILTLDGNNELWDDGQNLGTAMLQHVVDTLAGKELVGMARLTEAVEEQRQIVVVVQPLDLHL